MSQTDSKSTRMLITAGPTHEPIDAVRYIANRSSGRMGLALARAAVERGHETTLLLGPTHLAAAESPHLTTIRFRTTADLLDLLRRHWPNHDVLLMAAAVADYRPAAPHGDRKLPRTEASMTLKLDPTPDLLAELSGLTRADQCLIGFALEPVERLIESARAKLQAKGLAAIVANPLGTMESESIDGVLVLRNGRELRPTGAPTKEAFAGWLVDQLEEICGKTTTSIGTATVGEPAPSDLRPTP